VLLFEAWRIFSRGYVFEFGESQMNGRDAGTGTRWRGLTNNDWKTDGEKLKIKKRR